MDWSNETVFEFLEAYHGEPVLWDPMHAQHKDKRKVTDAWDRLSVQLNRPVPELKKKKDSLMATFRGHLRKKKASIRSGAGGDNVYKPLWFAYEYMEEFLAPVYEITTTVNTDAPLNEKKSLNLVVDDVGNMSQDLLAEETVDSREQLLTQETPHSTPLSPASVPPRLPTPRPTSAVRETQSQQTIRRRRNPPELQQAENQMSQAFQMLNNVALNKRPSSEPDECELFGQIIAKKLKKFPADERELLMYDIQGMFLRRRNLNMHPETTSSASHSRPSSRESSSYVSGDQRAQYTNLQSPQSVSPSYNQGSANFVHAVASGTQCQPDTHNTELTPEDMLASVIGMTFSRN